MRTQFLCLCRPSRKLPLSHGLQPATRNILFVHAGIGLLDRIILQAGSKLPGRTNLPARLTLALTNFLAVIHHAITELHEILPAVLALANAMPLHNHVHYLMIHQLRNIIDANHRSNLRRSIFKRHHIKIRNICRRRRRLGFLYKLAYRILETIKAVRLQAFNRTALRIGVALDHNRIHQFGEYTDCFRMCHVQRIKIGGCCP